MLGCLIQEKRTHTYYYIIIRARLQKANQTLANCSMSAHAYINDDVKTKPKRNSYYHVTCEFILYISDKILLYLFAPDCSPFFVRLFGLFYFIFSQIYLCNVY